MVVALAALRILTSVIFSARSLAEALAVAALAAVVQDATHRPVARAFV